MLAWLESDLQANQKRCTLAYFHRPLFSSGGPPQGNPGQTRTIWDLLYSYDADLVVNGHEHQYERFAPQDPEGVADSARGIREFVVGTGGRKLNEFKTTAANSEARNSDTYDVIKLTLHRSSYDWEFVPIAGQTFTDSGSQSWH